MRHVSHRLFREEGRLWFVADGQRIDITDRIDEETPYLYTSEDEAGNRTYIVVGGRAAKLRLDGTVGVRRRRQCGGGVRQRNRKRSRGAGLTGQRPGTAGTHRIKGQGAPPCFLPVGLV